MVSSFRFARTFVHIRATLFFPFGFYLCYIPNKTYFVCFGFFFFCMYSKSLHGNYVTYAKLKLHVIYSFNNNINNNKKQYCDFNITMTSMIFPFGFSMDEMYKNWESRASKITTTTTKVYPSAFRLHTATQQKETTMK